MIDQTINDTTISASPAGQARELTIGIVERVGPDVKGHANNVGSEVAIVIQMTCDDSEETAQDRHRHRIQSEFSKNLSKAEPNLSIKVKVEKPFRLPYLVSLFECRGYRYHRSH